MAGLVDQRPVRLDGTADDGGDFHGLQPQLDSAGGDPRDLQQVVDEPHHVIDLPLQHFQHAIGSRVVAARQPQDIERIADRRQRIAELVGQRRQKLVLAAVSLKEGLLKPLASVMSRAIFDAPTTLPWAS